MTALKKREYLQAVQKEDQMLSVSLFLWLLIMTLLVSRKQLDASEKKL